MPDVSSSSPSVPVAALASALKAPLRWKILFNLAGGEQLIVVEIAERVGASPDLVSKHMAVLRQAGVVTVGRNRLYQVPPQFLADKTNRLLDFGFCLLRAPNAADAAPQR